MLIPLSIFEIYPLITLYTNSEEHPELCRYITIIIVNNK